MFLGGIMERDLEKVAWNRLATFPFLMACELQENIKVWFSPSKKSWFYLLQWKAFKDDEKCFLFHFRL